MTQWRFQHDDDPRAWFSARSAARVKAVTQLAHGLGAEGMARHLHAVIARNDAIHNQQCLNLNPATNTMNPEAERAMASGLGTRPSLGDPGEKYEMGLEAMEELEVLATALVREVCNARHAELRLPSGAIANLATFMATCRPGDPIVAASSRIGGHVTHHDAGAAGRYGLKILPTPVDADRWTVDVDALAVMVRQIKPRLITIGGSLNVGHHPVATVREIADTVGATVMFDAAHLSGLIAGGAWPNPLAEGAHVVTMSTYKSLAGPPGGLVLTNDDELAQRVDAIAYPSLTANFDAGRVAALAMTMLDWIEHGRAHAVELVETADRLVNGLRAVGLPVAGPRGPWVSHQFALDASELGGGTAAAERLRRANLLTSAIGLPADPEDGPASGLRMGTPELVRWGIVGEAVPQVVAFIAQAWRLDDPASIAPRVTRFRQEFTRVRHIRTAAG